MPKMRSAITAISATPPATTAWTIDIGASDERRDVQQPGEPADAHADREPLRATRARPRCCSGRRMSTDGAAQAPRCLKKNARLLPTAQSSAKRMPSWSVMQERCAGPIRWREPRTVLVIGTRTGGVDRSARHRVPRKPLSGCAGTTVSAENPCKPMLLVDVDGVISLFGFTSSERPAGTWMIVDGSPHLISAAAAEHLQALGADFELVWCTGWEEKANEYLPGAARAARRAAVPELRPEPRARPRPLEARGDRGLRGAGPAARVGRRRAQRGVPRLGGERGAPTLLVETLPDVGLGDEHVDALGGWARGALTRLSASDRLQSSAPHARR